MLSCELDRVGLQPLLPEKPPIRQVLLSLSSTLVPLHPSIWKVLLCSLLCRQKALVEDSVEQEVDLLRPKRTPKFKSKYRPGFCLEDHSKIHIVVLSVNLRLV